MSVDPFVTVKPDVARDRWDRPLIIPPGGGEPVPYTRASTFASALDDSHGITVWKLRNLALGIGRHEDLAAMLAGLDYDRDKRAIDDIVATAIDRAGGTTKANWGTAVHSFTEPGASPFVPDRMRGDVDAYQDALDRHGITVAATEQFVVNDDLQVAGTFDHIYDVPGLGRVVGDKKTGTLHPHAVAAQLAVYANAQGYEVVDGEPVRTPLDVRTDIGLAVHIPAGAATAEIHTVDLHAGLAACRLALEVRAHRTRDDLLKPYAPPETESAATVDDLAELIAVAMTETELGDLWRTHKAIWTEEMSRLAAVRKSLLAMTPPDHPARTGPGNTNTRRSTT